MLLPFLLSPLRGVVSLRLLRLFTLFRLERKHKFFSPILLVVSNKRTELGATLGIAGLLLLISSTLMYYVESGGSRRLWDFPLACDLVLGR